MAPGFFKQMNATSETFSQIVLHEGQFFLQQVKNILLGNQEEAIRKMLGDISIPLPRLFSLVLPGGDPVFPVFFSLNNTLLVAMQLPALPFKGYFKEQGEFWIPSSRGESQNGAGVFKRKNLLYNLPDTYLVFRFAPRSPEPTCHLLTRIDKELYSPPYPNTYDDGKLCMGDDFSPRGDTYQEICQATLEYFYDTDFNSDLNTRYTSQLFKFDNNESPVIPESPESLIKISSRKVSSAFFNFLLA